MSPDMIVYPDHEKVFKYIRLCVLITAATEMVVGALSIAANIGIFTYYLLEASNGTGDKGPNFFFEGVIDSDLFISAKTFSKVAAFMFVYSVVHFLASVFLFQGAKKLSHEKCRWAFILHICLWTIGIVVLLAPLSDKVILWLFITVFSFKIAELALIKRFMDELHFHGYDG